LASVVLFCRSRATLDQAEGTKSDALHFQTPQSEQDWIIISFACTVFHHVVRCQGSAGRARAILTCKYLFSSPSPPLGTSHVIATVCVALASDVFFILQLMLQTATMAKLAKVCMHDLGRHA
jgi:hypothetical protein